MISLKLLSCIIRLSCIIITITAGSILIKSMIDERRGLIEQGVREMPVAATIWLAVGVWGMLPEALHYLLLQS